MFKSNVYVLVGLILIMGILSFHNFNSLAPVNSYPTIVD